MKIKSSTILFAGSSLALIDNNIVFYSLSFASLIILLVSRLSKLNRKAIPIILILGNILCLNYLYSQPELELQNIAKIVCGFIILLSVKKSDLKDFRRLLSYFVIVHFLFQLSGYFLDANPIGRFYVGPSLLGGSVNSGLVYEINYSSFIYLFILFSIPVLLRTPFGYFIAGITSGRIILLISVIFTGSGVVQYFIKHQLIQKISILIAVIFWYSVLIWTFHNYPIFLEQRFWQFKSLIENYELFKIYSHAEVYEIMKEGLHYSPWKDIGGYVAHNAIFDHVGYLGVPVFLIVLLAYVIGLFRLPVIDFAIFSAIMVFMPLMSISFGGLGVHSIYFSMLIGVSLLFKAEDSFKAKESVYGHK